MRLNLNSLSFTVALAWAVSFSYSQWSFAEPPVQQSKPQALSKQDHTALEALDRRYQEASSVSMLVERTVKSGLLGHERKAHGTLLLSGGMLRMELNGDEKTLLVVNKRSFWAVTYPEPEFKDAPVRVVQADIGNKKAKTQNLVGLLSQGGLFKQFTPTGTHTLEGGSTVYFLQPKKGVAEFKRAQIVISKDGKKIESLRYWDELDNESHFEFKDVVFGKKVDEKLFTFTPPKNSEIMTL